MSEERACRECGISHIEPGIEIDAEPLCWAEDDLCSRCQDFLLKQQETDAARYRYLRNRSTSSAAIAEGGVFGGQIPDNLILGGEDLARAIDAAISQSAGRYGAALERRLALCLAEIVDQPLLTGQDAPGGFSSPLEIRLGFFKPELANRAAELLEEAGL